MLQCSLGMETSSCSNYDGVELGENCQIDESTNQIEESSLDACQLNDANRFNINYLLWSLIALKYALV